MAPPSIWELTPTHSSFIVPPEKKMLYHKKLLLGWVLTSGNLKHMLTRNLKSVAKRENLEGGIWKFTCCHGYFSVFWIIFRQVLFKFFDPNSDCFARYDAFCSHIFDYACLTYGLSLLKKFEIMEKLYRPTSKHFWKWLVGGCINSTLLILSPKP